MLRKIAISLLTAGAMGAVALAPAAAAPSSDPGPASGPVTAMSWHHSGYYASNGICTVQRALLHGSGVPTMPGTGACYTSAQGHFFYYWS